MLLFLVSFLLIFLSSYLITSTLTPKKHFLGFLYLFIFAFAQIIVSFEILSLFSLMKVPFVLLLNVIFLLGSIFVWLKSSGPMWIPDVSVFRNRVLNSFKFDHSLFILYVGFCVFVIAAVILCIFSSVNNMDALDYHLARSLFWVFNGNLNHFPVSDIRALCLPINSEILYTWVLMFVKKDLFLGFFSLVGFFLSIVSIYGILSEIGFSARKKLWAVFIVSSFPNVIVQASGTETDIIISGLVLSSVYMFLFAIKNMNNVDKRYNAVPLFVSSLSYAIAVGTKTPAFMAIPSVGILFLFLAFHYLGKDFYKPLLKFIIFGCLNFLIFSAYNYILNYIDFGNFMSSNSFMLVSKNYYGLKGAISSFVKYLFMFVDTSGFRWGDYIGDSVVHLKKAVLSALGVGFVPDGLYTWATYKVNKSLIEPLVGFGILGFFVLLPCWMYSLSIPFINFKKPLFKKKMFFIWGVMFLLNLIVLSVSLAYMAYSIRFIMFFALISSPFLVMSYRKKSFAKGLVVFFAVFSLVVFSLNVWPRPLLKMAYFLSAGHSFEELHEDMNCDALGRKTQNPMCALTHGIKNVYAPENKILVFANSSDSIFILKALSFKGYHIDFGRLEDVEKINIDNYNLIISKKDHQISTVINDYDRRKNESWLRNKTITFKIKSLVPCSYLPNSTLPKDVKGTQMPYYSLCTMSSEFKKKHNLQFFIYSGIFYPNHSSDDLYEIYYNGNRPPILKK